MKKFQLILIAVFITALSSCSFTRPGMVTNNEIGSKTGVAERKIILGISFGHTDLGISTAAKNGGISKVATVDYEIEGGLFTTTYKTIVTGK